MTEKKDQLLNKTSPELNLWLYIIVLCDLSQDICYTLVTNAYI